MKIFLRCTEADGFHGRVGDATRSFVGTKDADDAFGR